MKKLAIVFSINAFSILLLIYLIVDTGFMAYLNPSITTKEIGNAVEKCYHLFLLVIILSVVICAISIVLDIVKKLKTNKKE